jgi:PEGA domain
MRRLLSGVLVVCSALGNVAFSQKLTSPGSAAVPNSALPDTKPRVFVTDSNSWSMQGSSGGSGGSFGGSYAGGARPQTAEIIKTFGQRCPQVIVNNHADASNYIVELDHEGGKGLLSHKDKVAVFVQKTGDSIFSKSTLSVGGSVQDACTALIAHWGAHAAELLAAAPSGYGSGGYGAGGYGGAPVPVPAMPLSASGLTVEASVPNCDIEVDGSFVGSTPSTLNLAPGKHEIVVKKAGSQDWSRSMLVGGGSVRLSAEMVAK